ncbi:MAG: hypothetical protein AMXMBFR53_20000 [Gemmatimonadota bacterium]
MWSGLLLTFPVDPDYTAGELLDHVAGWRETGVLYPRLGEGPTLRVLNYPPLVLAAVRAVAALGVPLLAAGRLVNGVGLLALLGAVALWARARGARGPVLAGTVGLLGASFPLLYGAGQLHLELWAVAGTVAGFALLATGSRRRDAVLGGLLLAAGCWAKQTQAVPALAALIWVWLHRRPSALRATAAFALGGGVGGAVVTLLWGSEAWRHMIVYTVGTYSLDSLGLQALSHAAPWALLLVFTAVTLREARGSGGDALAWYWVASLLWSLSAAREGSGYAYFLDLHVATALWAGPRIFGGGARGRWWPWLLAVQVVGADVGTGAALARNVARLHRVDRHLDDLCRSVASPQADGAPLLAERAGLARACGRPAVLHPFIMSSLARQGRWDPTPLERDVRAGVYAAVVLPFDPAGDGALGDPERWTPGMLQAFREAPSVEASETGYAVARW